MKVKVLAATAVAAGVFAPSALALAPLTVHIHDRFRDPTRVTESAQSSPAKTVTVTGLVRCGSSSRHERFTQPSGAVRQLALPRHHDGVCTVMVTASIPGYGSISARLAESGR